jgi:uncharacterized protein (UPF0261 family)
LIFTVFENKRQLLSNIINPLWNDYAVLQQQASHLIGLSCSSGNQLTTDAMQALNILLPNAFGVAAAIQKEVCLELSI